MATTFVLADATPYATFWSGNQKLASNKNGIMAGFITSRNETYTAQNTRVVWWDNDIEDAIVLGDITLPTNAPSILAATSGEFYALIPDIDNNILRIWYWPNIKTNTIKQEFTFSGIVIGGKWSAVFDEVRRRIIIIGQKSGNIYCFTDECVYTGSISVLEGINNGIQLQYPMMQLCEAGRLHIVYSTSDDIASTNNGAVTYRGLGYTWSSDLQNYTNRYTPMTDWGTVNWLQKPITINDNSPLNILRNEELWPNKLLSASLITSEHIHIIYSYTNKQSGRFAEYDGKRTKHVYTKIDRKTGKTSVIQWPIQSTSKRSWFPGSFLVKRNEIIYHIYSDGNEILIDRWCDNTQQWICIHVLVLPGYVDGRNFIHYISGRLGETTDNYIDFVCTVINSSYTEWVNGATLYAPSKVIYVKIPLTEL